LLPHTKSSLLQLLASGTRQTSEMDGWHVEISDTAKRSHNPIRKIVEGLKMPDLPDKPHIPLSLGA